MRFTPCVSSVKLICDVNSRRFVIAVLYATLQARQIDLCKRLCEAWAKMMDLQPADGNAVAGCAPLVSSMGWVLLEA